MPNRRSDPFRLTLHLCTSCGRPQVRLVSAGGAHDGLDTRACLDPEQLVGLTAAALVLAHRAGLHDRITARVEELRREGL